MITSRKQLRTVNDVLSHQLEDPEFRKQWERTAVARAVALRLVAYRSEHGLSQTRLARILAMSQPAVARLESGEHVPTIDTLVRLSQALNIEFLVDIKPRERQSTWVAPEAEQASIVEDITTREGSRILVAVS